MRFICCLKGRETLHGCMQNTPCLLTAVGIVERQRFTCRGRTPFGRQKGHVERDLRLVLATFIEHPGTVYRAAHISLPVNAVWRDDSKVKVKNL